MAEESHDWDKHKKSYMAVGIALFVFTFITLALGLYPPFDFGPPGPTPADFVLGLGVAGVKSTLVALIFMHLNHEKGLIYKTLVFTLLFFVGLMVLTLFTAADPIIEQYETFQSTNGKLLEEL